MYMWLLDRNTEVLKDIVLWVLALIRGKSLALVMELLSLALTLVIKVKFLALHSEACP